jgi:hypothetical protein
VTIRPKSTITEPHRPSGAICENRENKRDFR